MKFSRVTFFLILVSGAIFGASRPGWAIQGAKFAELKAEILNKSPEAILLKDAAFNATQISEFSLALTKCQKYLAVLSLIGLKPNSKNTEILFTNLKQNTSIYNLELNESYLSDEAMNALIDLLTPNSNNSSKIERVFMDGVKTSEKSWLNFAQAMENFDLVEISLREIREVIAGQEGNSMERPYKIDRLLDELETSLSDVSRLLVNLSDNKLRDPEKLSAVNFNTRRLVQVRFEDPTLMLPWWSGVGLVGAGILIGYAGLSTKEI